MQQLKRHYDRRRAGAALGDLSDGLTGRGAPPDYDDQYVPVAYLIDYQLKHCALAFAVWWDFFRRHGVPSGLSVFDFGAGSAAGVVGLNIALDLRRRARLPVVDGRQIRFGSYEPSEPMHWIGDKFVAFLGLSIKPGYCRLPDLRNRRRGDAVLEVVTAFHPALPWDGANDLGTVVNHCRRALAQVAPDVVLGTAHTGKERSLRNLLGAGRSKLVALSSDGLSDFVNRPSRFYANGIPIADGFEYPAASSDDRKSLRHHSRYRFSLPQAVLVENLPMAM